jgi:hypothetical protein
MTWRIVRPLRTRLAPFARFGEHGAGGRDRVFKGSKVDLTNRPRYEEPKKDESDARADICQTYDSIGRGSNEDRTRIIDGFRYDSPRMISR